MKKLIILTVLITVTVAYSQNRIDPVSLLDSLKANTIFNFERNHFIKAWNWSSETRKLDSALLMDYNHVSSGLLPHFNKPQTPYNELVPYMYKENQNWIFAIPEVVSDDKTPSMTQAQSISFKPSIDVTTGDDFVPISGDTTGSVFGFQYKNPDFNSCQTISQNYVLRKSIMDSLLIDTVTVLDNPWPADELFNLIYMSNRKINF